MLLDGGIRRGSDVVKALALGARAVMIGRAYLWGLAANGQAGVENVLDILRGGIDSALMGLGRRRSTTSSPDDILVPAGFTRALGVPARPWCLSAAPLPADALGQAWPGGGRDCRQPSRRNVENKFCPCANNRRTPGEFGLPSAGGFPQRAWELDVEAAPQASPALVIPVGSTEQHGPHLPLDTDTRIATAVARGGC